MAASLSPAAPVTAAGAPAPLPFTSQPPAIYIPTPDGERIEVPADDLPPALELVKLLKEEVQAPLSTWTTFLTAY
jgi:hypothetical protein